jgi:heme/copper-type cytochrome/quinol oxidase subunit 4
MNRLGEGINLQIAALLVVLELLAVYFLWTLNPVGAASEATFALFLAICLVSFAMVSYIYRVDKRGDGINRGVFLAGCVMILVLLFAGLLWP